MNEKLISIIGGALVGVAMHYTVELAAKKVAKYKAKKKVEKQPVVVVVEAKQ